MKKRPISWLVFVGLICLPYTVLADNGAVGIVSQNVGPAPRSSSDSELQAQINERMKYKNFIKEELTSLNEQIAQCQQEKKKWKTATILGGVGMVATGAVAIGQKVNHNKQEKENLLTVEFYLY